MGAKQTRLREPTTRLEKPNNQAMGAILYCEERLPLTTMITDPVDHIRPLAIIQINITIMAREAESSG